MERECTIKSAFKVENLLKWLCKAMFVCRMVESQNYWSDSAGVGKIEIVKLTGKYTQKKK